MNSRQGRLAIVTGAAGGIGYAIAERLGSGGHRVILTDVQEKVAEAADRLRQAGLKAEHRILDIADERQVASCFDAICAEGRSVGILVNNASISPKHDGRSLQLVDTSLDEWERVIRVNLTGAFLMSRAAVPGMRAQNWGRIINIASLAGRTRSLISGSHYSASKAGVLGMSRMFAGEVAPHGITVNSVAPGFILSNPATMRQWAAYGEAGQRALVAGIAARRLGTPEDIAHAVLFLASDYAAYINGQTLSVDGGK